MALTLRWASEVSDTNEHTNKVARQCMWCEMCAKMPVPRKHNAQVIVSRGYIRLRFGELLMFPCGSLQ